MYDGLFYCWYSTTNYQKMVIALGYTYEIFTLDIHFDYLCYSDLYYLPQNISIIRLIQIYEEHMSCRNPKYLLHLSFI